MGTGVAFITTSNVRWYDGDPANAGCGLGSTATSKVGFFGATPIVQPSVTAVGTATATTTLNETRISRLYTALENLGLIVTA